MKYSLNEYMKLFDVEKHHGDDPDDETLYDTYVTYRVNYRSQKSGKWCCSCPAAFRKKEEAEDYANYVFRGRETQIETWCLGAGFPETINWKESRLRGYWVLDDWE